MCKSHDIVFNMLAQYESLRLRIFYSSVLQHLKSEKCELQIKLQSEKSFIKSDKSLILDYLNPEFKFFITLHSIDQSLKH